MNNRNIQSYLISMANDHFTKFVSNLDYLVQFFGTFRVAVSTHRL